MKSPLRQILPALAVLSAFALHTERLYAHSRWNLDGPIKPRTDDAGLKLPAPCGGAVIDETRRATLTAGQSLVVKWQETVNHTGHFRIAFSPGDDLGFDANILQDNIPDDQNDSIVPHQYSATITVPDVLCDKCTLQLIQFMAETGTVYNSCADVKIVKEGQPTATATATSTGSDSSTSTSTSTATTKAKPAAPTGLTITVKKVGEP